MLTHVIPMVFSRKAKGYDACRERLLHISCLTDLGGAYGIGVGFVT